MPEGEGEKGIAIRGTQERLGGGGYERNRRGESRRRRTRGKDLHYTHPYTVSHKMEHM